MDTLLKEMLTTGGPLGVLVCVVFIFVRDRHVASLEHRAWLDSIMKSNQEVLKQLHDDHMVARQISANALDKNTAAMMANTAAMQTVAEAVRWCPKKPEH